jgi:hypothetical protein
MFARRLIDHESAENGSAGPRNPATFRSCEKLRLHLANILGNIGFHALLARALALATVEVPWLRAVKVKADGTLEGLAELQSQLNADELFEGGVVLLARLLGLLVDFIGLSLTLRLVGEVWPKLPLDDLDPGGGGKNEYAGKKENEYAGKNENEYAGKNEKAR